MESKNGESGMDMRREEVKRHRKSDTQDIEGVAESN